MGQTNDTFVRNLRALWRSKWFVMLGLCIAVVAPLLMLYKAKWPPTPRTRPHYVAKTQILVDSPTGPFLRTQPKILGTQSQKKGTVPTTRPGQSPVVPSVSDTKSLVDAANLFPLFVTSDEVSALRQKMFGPIRGSVSAKALFASQGVNRYRPTTVPVIEIVAVSRRPNPAIRMARGTARAFNVWLTDQQKQANIAPNQRIVLRPLQAATSAVKTGGAGMGLPIIVALAVIAGVAGLAIFYDRARPRAATKGRRAPVADTAGEEAPRRSDDEVLGVASPSASASAPGR